MEISFEVLAELKREAQVEIDATSLFIKETIPRKFNIVAHIE